MRRFEVFTTDELAVLGVGAALAGGLGDMKEEATPLINEINKELNLRSSEDEATI